LVADDIVSLFQQAGLPSGVLQSLHSGDADLIAEVINLPQISAVSFTGSVEGGLAVQKAASGRTIPVALELGGNDAAYVRADISDFHATAADIVDGALFNSGQSCCAIERVYVDRRIFRPFVDQVVNVVKKYVVGDPFNEKTQLGPVISEKAARNIRAQIKDAMDRGAKSLIPEHFFAEAERLNPTFVGPQVLVDLDESSLVVSTETFGPVIQIIAVDSDKEAIAKINDSDLGLTASVWTTDIETGEAVANQLEAGTVFVNRADYPDPHLAWTGFKNSGRGVSLSKYGFGFFTKLKSHHLKLQA
jgi:acyl-CoA reductase-like NAD-dependent aldehyde dehydrogenase